MRKKIALLAIVLASCILAVGLWLRQFREPVLDGKPLKSWLAEFDCHPATPAAGALMQAAEKEVPWLGMMLRYRDTSLRAKFVAWLASKRLISTKIQPATVNQYQALVALGTLGLQSRRKLAHDTAALVRDFPRGTSAANAEVAVHFLAEMGPEGIDELLAIARNPTNQFRLRAIELLGTAPQSGTDAVLRQLGSLAGGQDPAIRNAASHSLQVLNQRLHQLLPPGASDCLPKATNSFPAENLWSLQHIRNHSNSELIPGFDWQNFFGSGGSGGGETGNVVFQDGHPDGFGHFFEWETREPVTVRSFGFILCNNGPGGRFARSARGVRLYAISENSAGAGLIYSEDLPMPYREGTFDSIAFFFRNLDHPVTAAKFRIEFIQCGADSGSGPRVSQVFAFGGHLDLNTLAGAVRPRNNDVAAMLPAFLKEISSSTK